MTEEAVLENLCEVADSFHQRGYAFGRTEELEQTARLHFILRGERVRRLTPEQVEELKRTFG